MRPNRPMGIPSDRPDLRWIEVMPERIARRPRFQPGHVGLRRVRNPRIPDVDAVEELDLLQPEHPPGPHPVQDSPAGRCNSGYQRHGQIREDIGGIPCRPVVPSILKPSSPRDAKEVEQGFRVTMLSVNPHARWGQGLCPRNTVPTRRRKPPRAAIQTAFMDQPKDCLRALAVVSGPRPLRFPPLP